MPLLVLSRNGRRVDVEPAPGKASKERQSLWRPRFGIDIVPGRKEVRVLMPRSSGGMYRVDRGTIIVKREPIPDAVADMDEDGDES